MTRAMPYGSGRTKASRYKGLKGEQKAELRRAKARAMREKPTPLPESGLPSEPMTVTIEPEKRLSLRLSDDAPRRDRNW